MNKGQIISCFVHIFIFPIVQKRNATKTKKKKKNGPLTGELAEEHIRSISISVSQKSIN